MRIRIDIIRRSDIRPDTVSVSTTVSGSVRATVTRVVRTLDVNTATHDVVISTD